MAGLLTGYSGAFNQHPLAAGETGTALCLATNVAQAKASMNYAVGFLQASPILSQQIVGEPTTEEMRLVGNVTVAVAPANFRTVRSRTLIAAVLDEVAWWRDDETSANPDSEVYSALLPAVATTGGMMIGISSPYRRSGLLFQKFERSFGKDDPSVLVVRAPSRLLNPTIGEDVVERARAQDPERARAEWDAEFRDDITDFISRAAIMDCVDAGVRERAPERKWRYVGFLDAASGSGTDSMTAAVALREGDTSVLAAIREVRPPFNPEAVVAEFAETFKRYRLSSVRADRWGGEWVAEAFRREGVNVEPAERTKSQLYMDVLPAINSGAVALLDNDRMVNQFVALERRVSRGGRGDTIDHPAGAHDDVANAVAGALRLAASSPAYHYLQNDRDFDKPFDEPDPLRNW